MSGFGYEERNEQQADYLGGRVIIIAAPKHLP
jgi:hypothetical protein